MKLRYDLHLHSCLSPCGDDGATPADIAGFCALAGVQVAALSDHNSTRNCPAFLEAAAAYGVLALPAMELTTAEEVHVLCLLPDLAAAEALEELVHARLPGVRNRPAVFGNQWVMDAGGRLVAEEAQLLIAAAGIGVYEVRDLVEGLGGAAVPAHIDRDAFSVLSNLGALPPDLGFRTVELSREADRAALLAADPSLRGLAVLVNSDAHRLADIPDAAASLTVPEATPQAVLAAIRSGAGLERL